MYVGLWLVILLDTTMTWPKTQVNTARCANVINKLKHVLSGDWKMIYTDNALDMLSELHENNYKLWGVFLFQQIANSTTPISPDISTYIKEMYTRNVPIHHWCNPQNKVATKCGGAKPCTSSVHLYPNRPCGLMLSYEDIWAEHYYISVSKLFHIKLFVIKLQMKFSGLQNSLVLFKRNLYSASYSQVHKFFGSHPPCELVVNSYEVMVEKMFGLIDTSNFTLRYTVVDVQVCLENVYIFKIFLPLNLRSELIA